MRNLKHSPWKSPQAAGRFTLLISYVPTRDLSMTLKEMFDLELQQGTLIRISTPSWK